MSEVNVSQVAENVRKVVEAFRSGKPILVFDSAFREQETDLLFPSFACTPEVIRKLRKDCGGLLFMAVSHEICENFQLPFLQDVYTHKATVDQFPVLAKLQTTDLKYDSKSAFTLTLNHRETFTGITDKDRSLTTRRFADLVSELQKSNFEESKWTSALGKEFRTPGHIPLCRETKGGLNVRHGHTELAVAIARMAGVVECTIGAEMMMPDGDRALPVEEAKKYGEAHGIPFVCGDDIIRANEILFGTTRLNGSINGH